MNTTISHILARIVVACLLVTGLAQAETAQAQVMKSLKEQMFGKHAVDGRSQTAPKVGRFVSDDGQGFVFDESNGHNALIRFDGEDEVWFLTPSQGTKGDVIFKNDVGDPVLKATRWGGLILFSDDRPMGDPVALKGRADAFKPAHMTPGLLFQALALASRRVSVLLERKVVFDAQEVTPESAPLYANAFDVTSDAMVQVATRSQGRRVLDNVHEVHFIDGRPPSANIDNGVLVLKLDVSRGAWGGHPSSKNIMNVIMTSFNVADRRR